MSVSEDLINFDVIENQKENIQSLPQGRSAKALAAAFAPPLLFSPVPTTGATRNLNDAIRQEYEKELLSISDSDDPLDIYDRYVKWTLNAYPSAQATSDSQLRPLLERATKAFQSVTHYKNDPRYLKLWLTYIRFFSDAPRETYAYLARHAIGETLALFYEEFAAWLEGAGRWTQAGEVYKLGIEREARPAERLLRKFSEFQHRLDQRPQSGDEPSSPALPTVRPALAAKLDPFAASTPRSADPQAQRLPSSVSTTSRTGREKIAVFSDADAPESVLQMGHSDASKGWDNIGSIQERKKENTVEAKPWAGETIKLAKKPVGAPKMMIFRDESQSQISKSEPSQTRPSPYADQQQVLNAKTGKIERVYVDLEAVYPNPNDPTEEYCFEELRAQQRGLLNKKWTREKNYHRNSAALQPSSKDTYPTDSISSDVTESITQNLTVELSDQAPSDTTGPIRGSQESKSGRPRRKKVVEVRGETQTIKINLESPSGRKLKRKNSAEPTMTLHTKAATDDILDIFNQPLRNVAPISEEPESDGESVYDDEDDYTSAGESTGTGRISTTTSEFGEDETNVRSSAVPDVSDPKSVSEWSEFTSSKHVPKTEDDDDDGDEDDEDGDLGHDFTRDEDMTGTSKSALTQTEEVTGTNKSTMEREQSNTGSGEREPSSTDAVEDVVVTPISPKAQLLVHTKFIPIPPEDYEAPTRPYRDALQISQNRLPFMTPIVEKTESSIGIPSQREDTVYSVSKTPSRRKGDATPEMPDIDDLLLSSPFQEIVNEATVSRMKKRNVKKLEAGETVTSSYAGEGPIIKDAQCNPVDDSIRAAILENIQPPLSSFAGFHDYRPLSFGKGPEIRRYVKALSKTSKNDKASATVSLPPTLSFPSSSHIAYDIKRELGKGAFAPVYLAERAEMTEQSQSSALEKEDLVAIKAEEPPTPWEFYIMSTAHRRLGQSRAAESVAKPYGMHLFADEGYLVESYHDQGTLLDLVNIAKADCSSSSGGGMLDECVVMFFAVELLRTVEALHSNGILHGDLKADNCLVRLAPSSSSLSSSTGSAAEGDWAAAYSPSGGQGWAARGLTLIDFGRGIDLHAHQADVLFIADWRTSKHDCPEMRELRPWTHQIDYWGAAGVIHVLLFGKWIEDVVDKNGTSLGSTDSVVDNDIVGAQKRYRLKEGLKRYWATELWSAVFDVLMNPGAWTAGEEHRRLPVSRRLREVRLALEAWLLEQGERRGLKMALRRLEEKIRERRRP